MTNLEFAVGKLRDSVNAGLAAFACHKRDLRREAAFSQFHQSVAEFLVKNSKSQASLAVQKAAFEAELRRLMKVLKVKVNLSSDSRLVSKASLAAKRQQGTPERPSSDQQRGRVFMSSSRTLPCSFSEGETPHSARAKQRAKQGLSLVPMGLSSATPTKAVGSPAAVQQASSPGRVEAQAMAGAKGTKQQQAAAAAKANRQAKKQVQRDQEQKAC